MCGENWHFSFSTNCKSLENSAALCHSAKCSVHAEVRPALLITTAIPDCAIGWQSDTTGRLWSMKRAVYDCCEREWKCARSVCARAREKFRCRIAQKWTSLFNGRAVYGSRVRHPGHRIVAHRVSRIDEEAKLRVARCVLPTLSQFAGNPNSDAARISWTRTRGRHNDTLVVAHFRSSISPSTRCLPARVVSTGPVHVDESSRRQTPSSLVHAREAGRTRLASSSRVRPLDGHSCRLVIPPNRRKKRMNSARNDVTTTSSADGSFCIYVYTATRTTQSRGRRRSLKSSRAATRHVDESDDPRDTRATRLHDRAHNTAIRKKQNRSNDSQRIISAHAICAQTSACTSVREQSCEFL